MRKNDHKKYCSTYERNWQINEKHKYIMCLPLIELESGMRDKLVKQHDLLM